MFRSTVALIVFLVFAFQVPLEAEQKIYISPNGDDTNTGSRENPLATLQAARNKIREMNAYIATDSITVILREGSYRIRKTFELDHRDSGRPFAPITYRAESGEIVKLTGGAAIPSSAFEPVTDQKIHARLVSDARDKIFKVNLKALGITEYGQMQPSGFTQPNRSVAMELFFNQKPMQIARWPNVGYVTYGEVIDKGSIPRNRDPLSAEWPTGEQKQADPKDKSDRGAVFIFKHPRLKRWTKANDIWLNGYWAWDWADERIKVESIDSEAGKITLAGPHHYGLSPAKRFYAINLLEEIDAPGEYFIDRNKGYLYFYPPENVNGADIVVSTLAEPMIAMENVSHVTFEGFVLENSRSYAFYITGGAHNRVKNCTIRNFGNLAITIGEGKNGREIGDFGLAWHAALYRNPAWNRNAGTDNGVIGCHIYNIGHEGIALSGGDRITLTPGHNFVTHCNIHNIGRIAAQNRPSIFLDGVGNYIAHNDLYDHPHSVIIYYGNDHHIEFNKIHHCVYDSSDAGAIYNGREPASRGNRIANNFFHHIGPEKHRGFGAQSIFFDDGSCGHLVTRNIFYKAGTNGTVHFNGGFDNIVKNNLFIDTPKHMIGGYWGNDLWRQRVINGRIYQRRALHTVNITRPPYSTRYPEIKEILADPAGKQRTNHDIDNIIVDTPNQFLDTDTMKLAEDLNKAAREYNPDFQPIDIDAIGPDPKIYHPPI